MPGFFMVMLTTAASIVLPVYATLLCGDSCRPASFYDYGGYKYLVALPVLWGVLLKYSSCAADVFEEEEHPMRKALVRVENPPLERPRRRNAIPRDAHTVTYSYRFGSPAPPFWKTCVPWALGLHWCRQIGVAC